MTHRPWWTGLGTIALASLLPGAGMIMAFFMPGILVAQCAAVDRERLGPLWPSLFLLVLALGLFLEGALFVGTELLLFSWGLYWAREKGLEIPQILIWVTTLFALFYGLFFLYGYIVSGIDLEAILREIREAIQKGLSPYDLDQDHQKKIVDSLVEFIPFLIALSVICITYCNILVANFIGRRMGKNEATIFGPRFESFRLPENLIWLGILGGAGTLFLHGPIKIAATNLLFTVLALYCIQGAGMLKYFMTRYGVNRIIQWVVFLLISTSWYGLVGVTIMGVSDVWTDVRKTRLEGTDSSHGNV